MRWMTWRAISGRPYAVVGDVRGAAVPHAPPHGKAMQVEPVKPMLKEPGTKRLKLNFVKVLSFTAFNVTTCAATTWRARCFATGCWSRRAPSPTTSRQGLTLVHFSAQRKHILLDTLGASFFPGLLDRVDTGRCDQNGLG